MLFSSGSENAAVRSLPARAMPVNVTIQRADVGYILPGSEMVLPHRDRVKSLQGIGSLQAQICKSGFKSSHVVRVSLMSMAASLLAHRENDSAISLKSVNWLKLVY